MNNENNIKFVNLKFVRGLEAKGYPATAAYIRTKIMTDDPYVDVDLIEDMMKFEAYRRG